MDTIKNYLENMFMNLPKTQQISKAKADLLEMMEDKYNELKAEGKTENEAIGTVISEFGNLSELAEELGIKSCVEEAGREPERRKVSLEETKEYLASVVASSARIALGVFLCICSPIALIITDAVTAGKPINSIATALTVALMLCMVAVAVGIFIYSGMTLSKYNYLKKEVFQLDYETVGYVKQLRESKRSNFTLKITIGVVLCIIGIIPIIVVGSIVDGTQITIWAELWESISVGLLMALVAIAVMLFITAGMEESAIKVLLKEEEYAKDKKENSLAGNVAAVYWPVVTCIFLAWSFISGDWGKSWIVWPIAGVLFGAIASICNIVSKKMV